jgi:acyl transferase domain-containing protein
MKDSPSDDIAIIGLSGRFPGAANVDEFWRNLVAGVESISTFTDEELAASGLDPAAVRKDPSQVPARGIVRDAEWFDAPFFGLSAKQAEVTDPQQRLFLEASWEVLENAGYDPARVEGPIGVYAGMGDATYYLNQLHSRTDITDLVGERVINLGNEKDYLATWVAYKLNLRGPAISVNTACSTSLVAVCQACQSLLHYQCDLALAGGVWISFPQRRSIRFQEGGIFSPDGHCRPFDARAQGTVSSDGLGIVLLKRLDEAIADGDQVLAVTKGFGLNNDGADKVGFTAPSVDGQAEAVATALSSAGVDAGTVSYVECHGTATPIGDPIEIAGLTQAFRLDTAEKNFCAIGSVKSNLGHLSSAAGAAGLIKTVLALQHKVLPASLHFSRPNPKIDFANSPFFVNATLRKWDHVPLPRRAGVSSFGLGGTNAHVVLEEAPAPEPSGPSRPWQLVLLSAKTDSALETASANLAAHLEATPALSLADAAFTLQQGRQVFDHRQMLVCRDLDDARHALAARDPKRVFVHHGKLENPPVVFMFPGQGAQHVNMGADLYRTEAVFREEIDRCAEILRPALGLDLREVIYPAADKTKDAEELLTQTRLTQPALFAVEFALATLWKSWGIKPAALIGHSIGEYVAACLAGVFTLEDALALVAQRGQLMQGMPRGTMLAVQLPEGDLRKILPATLSLAAVNGPSHCVVSGPAPEVEAFLATLTASGKTGVVLHTSHAFHSAMMDPILESFAAQVSRVRRSRPNLPFVSNLTGTWITDDEAVDPHYWARHLRHTVRFGDGIRELLKKQNSILLEVGPGTTLGSLAKLQPGSASGPAIVSSLRHLRDQSPDLACLLSALGRLWLHGVPVDWSGFYAQEKRRRVSLPTYPFERERYWVDARRPSPTEASPNVAARRNQDPADWFYVPAWKQSNLPTPIAASALPQPKLRWLIFLDEGGLGEMLAEILETRQESVTRVVVGPGYRKINEDTYAINPERTADYEALISGLRALDHLPQKIVHLWSVSNATASAAPDRTQDLGLHSLLSLARALGEQSSATKVEIEIVSSGIHLVTGGETLHPEKATILGAGKVIPLEYPTISCRSTDIVVPEPGSKTEQRLLNQLLGEFSTKPSRAVVAFRAGSRWVQAFEPIHLHPPGDVASRLKIGGVYLITGGLGGIGLTLAEFLATRVQAKLILVGRSAFPPREQWADWLAAHDDQDETSRLIKKIQALETTGAEVLVLAADVTDRDRMKEVIAQAKSRFGPIDGVIHAAGSPDEGGVIQRRTKEDTDRILAAKVQGTLVLNELLATRGLDFLVLCSTRNTLISGASFGHVGYIAANEFLDAFAFYKRAVDDVYTVTIDWDFWRDVGMAVRAARNQSGGKAAPELTDANSLSPSEGADAFNRILNYSFARVVVTVVPLDVPERNPTIDQHLTKHLPTIKQKTARLQATRHARPARAGQTFTAPTNKVERVLAGIWQDLLGLQDVGVDDNFFDLGGDSLLLLRVQAGILEALQVNLSSAEMFQHTTIKALAQRLSQPAAKPAGLSAIQDRAQLQRAALGQRPITKER